MNFEDYVNKFYEELKNDEHFNGNYIQARINAIAMARAYMFLKDYIKKGNKNE